MTGRVRLWLAVAAVWACAVTAATAVAVWQNRQIGQEREARICESLDRFAVFLGHELGADEATIDDARARLTVELEC